MASSPDHPLYSLKGIPKASQALSTVGAFLSAPNFDFSGSPLVRGAGV